MLTVGAAPVVTLNKEDEAKFIVLVELSIPENASKIPVIESPANVGVEAVVIACIVLRVVEAPEEEIVSEAPGTSWAY